MLLFPCALFAVSIDICICLFLIFESFMLAATLLCNIFTLLCMYCHSQLYSRFSVCLCHFCLQVGSSSYSCWMVIVCFYFHVLCFLCHSIFVLLLFLFFVSFMVMPTYCCLIHLRCFAFTAISTCIVFSLPLEFMLFLSTGKLLFFELLHCDVVLLFVSALFGVSIYICIVVIFDLRVVHGCGNIVI